MFNDAISRNNLSKNRGSYTKSKFIKWIPSHDWWPLCKRTPWNGRNSQQLFRVEEYSTILRPEKIDKQKCRTYVDVISRHSCSPIFSRRRTVQRSLTRNNCCKFLVLNGIILQSVHQSYFKMSVCGVSCCTDTFCLNKNVLQSFNVSRFT